MNRNFLNEEGVWKRNVFLEGSVREFGVKVPNICRRLIVRKDVASSNDGICRLIFVLAVLGLGCCADFSLVAESWGFSSWWLLLLRSPGSRARGLSRCNSQALGHRLNSFGAWAQLLCGLWGLPGSGIKPTSPALAGGFFTTEPPRKPLIFLFFFFSYLH